MTRWEAIAYANGMWGTRRKVIHCCACLHEFRGDLDILLAGPVSLGCPKCKSEDIFYKSDTEWRCTVCKREDIYAETGKFGFVCSSCKNPPFFLGL